MDMSNIYADPVKVVIADDSLIVRGFLIRALQNDPGISIVATATNGMSVLELLKNQDVDILMLDIEMPEMDGLTVLPEALKISPHLKILIISNLTQRSTPIAIKALSLGAADYLEKPSAQEENISNFTKELLIKVKALGQSTKLAKNYQKLIEQKAGTNIIKPRAEHNLSDMKSEIILRQTQGTMRPAALAIACSTGGPRALQELFAGLQNSMSLQVPIFITQHMPKVFSPYMLNYLEKISGMPCEEGKQDCQVKSGRVYIAPSDFHMIVCKHGSNINININQDAPENFCRPSADPMLRSLAKVYGKELMVIILTGMGQDGLNGARAVIEAGGSVVAQDEYTSVVWGMPGAVAMAGLCSAVLPLSQIAQYVLNKLQVMPSDTIKENG